MQERSTDFSSWDAISPINEQYALWGIPSWSTKQAKRIILNWKLSKIISPFSKELNFTYNEGLHCSYPRYSSNTNVNVNNSTQGNSTTINAPTNELFTASVTIFHNKYLNAMFKL